ncbi:hypothetical protein J1605_012808 [Eschrichtius robustus]|uniref:Secreted protein n=1 Tax=Eschrichtius robustus TaxID=9764 RepID=A0AB34GKM0_ESCRO|nr:hypothetical protein J1605_012808 [Eschrichtius robustus]
MLLGLLMPLETVGFYCCTWISQVCDAPFGQQAALSEATVFGVSTTPQELRVQHVCASSHATQKGCISRKIPEPLSSDVIYSPGHPCDPIEELLEH